MKSNSNYINERLKELEELQKKIERLSADAESIKDEIKRFMGEEEELITEDYTVRWTHVTTNRFDTKMFKSRYPEMYDAFLTESNSRRFTIK